MLLDAPHARLKLADQNAVADDGGMVFDHRATQSDDLFAELLAGREEVGRDIGPEAVHVGGDIEFRSDFVAKSARIWPTSVRTSRVRRASGVEARG
jgi:hypothetical protein